MSASAHIMRAQTPAHRLAGCDAQDLRREANGALDAKLLVLCAGNEIRRDYSSSAVRGGGGTKARTLLEVLDIAAGQSDADFVDFHAGDGRAGRVIFFFSLSDVTH